MRFSSLKPWLAGIALATAATLSWAQIEQLTLAQMVAKTDNAVDGQIVKSRVFRVDSPVDGPELYFTTLTVQGRSLVNDQDVSLDVTFPGGFISRDEGVYNSEAPSADDIKVGNRVIVFSKWSDNMGGGVAAHALYASHGGLYRVTTGKQGTVALGRGEGYAISDNLKVSDLRTSVQAHAKLKKQ